jgi:hypothetical protein
MAKTIGDVSLRLCSSWPGETPGADARVVLPFALWHDALRRDQDDDDLEQGVRAAKLVADLPGLVEPLNEEKRRDYVKPLPITTAD